MPRTQVFILFLLGYGVTPWDCQFSLPNRYLKVCVLNLSLSHVALIYSLTQQILTAPVPGHVLALGLNPSFLLPDPVQDTYP